MTGIPSRSRIALLAAALLVATPGVAFPQATVAAREGNIWGGRDHQPRPAQVTHDEQAAGIAPSPGQKDATAQEVQHLYQYLMRNTPPGAG
jgi:hypothetical protein